MGKRHTQAQKFGKKFQVLPIGVEPTASWWLGNKTTPLTIVLVFFMIIYKHQGHTHHVPIYTIEYNFTFYILQCKLFSKPSITHLVRIQNVLITTILNE